MDKTVIVCFRTEIDHRLTAFQQMLLITPFLFYLRQTAALINQMLVAICPIIKKGEFSNDLLCFLLCRLPVCHSATHTVPDSASDLFCELSDFDVFASRRTSPHLQDRRKLS